MNTEKEDLMEDVLYDIPEDMPTDEDYLLLDLVENEH